MRDLNKLRVRDTDRGAVIAVKVVPGSSREAIVGVLGDRLKIATAAAAEKGRANAAAAKTLARALGTDGRAVKIVAGHTSPRKEFLVAGMSAAAARKALAALAGNAGTATGRAK